MKFSSPIEMLEYIQKNNGIWSPELEIYVFLYSELGSICYYHINFDEAKELEILSKKDKKHEYWGAFLGFGGYICDTVEWYRENIKSNISMYSDEIPYQSLAFCEDNFFAEWINCEDVLNI